MSTLSTQRYAALDVLRGITIAGMILVNNPGSWGSIFPPLKHAHWSGCTPTDLVFPFFLFIVGAALAFSYAKYNEELSSSSFKKLLKRSALILLTGLLLNAFPFYPTTQDPTLTFGQNYIEYINHIRIFGVLQRIALAYLVGGFLALWLKTPKKIFIAAITLLAVHSTIILATGDYSLEANIASKIDLWVAGENHIYKGFGIPFDPEGLLGVISASATLLIGFLAGNMIRQKDSKSDSVINLYTFGLISLAVGVVISIFIPINKPLWSASYVFYAGGWSLLMLAFSIFLIDIKRWEKLVFPFKALGMNPLFAFVMAGIFAKTLGRVIRWSNIVIDEEGNSSEIITNASSWFYQNCCVPIFGNNEFGSLFYALIYVAIFTTMAIVLYRKKIIIKL